MMSCPVGVDSTLPSSRTLREIPMDVGAKLAPTANALLISMLNASDARAVPMARGSNDPTMATVTPRIPTTASCDSSTSMPASSTIRTSPISPISMSASCLGASSAPCGPNTMPARICPTSSGRPQNLAASFPTTYTTHNRMHRYKISSKVNGAWWPSSAWSSVGECSSS